MKDNAPIIREAFEQAANGQRVIVLFRARTEAMQHFEALAKVHTGVDVTFRKSYMEVRFPDGVGHLKFRHIGHRGANIRGVLATRIYPTFEPTELEQEWLQACVASVQGEVIPL